MTYSLKYKEETFQMLIEFMKPSVSKGLSAMKRVNSR